MKHYKRLQGKFEQVKSNVISAIQLHLMFMGNLTEAEPEIDLKHHIQCLEIHGTITEANYAGFKCFDSSANIPYESINLETLLSLLKIVEEQTTEIKKQYRKKYIDSNKK